MANSRTGANSDEEEKEELLAPAAAGAAAEGYRAADAQAIDQLIPDVDQAEAERYRRYVIKQQ